MRNRLIVALAAIVMVAGCGKREEEKQTQAVKQGADQAKTGADQMAKGLEQMAQGLQQLATDAKNGQSTTPVDFQKLQAALPDMGGWTRGEPEGHSMTMPVPVSNTQARYTKGASEVTVTITDSAFSQLATAPLLMMTAAGYSEKTATGYKRATTVGGAPGYEEWDGSNKSGNVGAIVGKRFVVEASGEKIDSIDTLKSFVQKIDFNKLSAMK